jgi:hypothetical protein
MKENGDAAMRVMKKDFASFVWMFNLFLFGIQFIFL